MFVLINQSLTGLVLTQVLACSLKESSFKKHKDVLVQLIWESLPLSRLFNMAGMAAAWEASARSTEYHFSAIIGQPTFRYLWPTFWSHACFGNTLMLQFYNVCCSNTSRVSGWIDTCAGWYMHHFTLDFASTTAALHSCNNLIIMVLYCGVIVRESITKMFYFSLNLLRPIHLEQTALCPFCCLKSQLQASLRHHLHHNVYLVAALQHHITQSAWAMCLVMIEIGQLLPLFPVIMLSSTNICWSHILTTKTWDVSAKRPNFYTKNHI